LALFMARIAANDEHHPAAADNFAVVAYSFHAGSYFHDFVTVCFDLRSDSEPLTRSQFAETI
jgi:hypothetical protein